MGGSETYEVVGPRCPYCRHLHEPDGPDYFEDGVSNMRCNACAREFSMETYTSTSWTCQPLDSDHG